MVWVSELCVTLLLSFAVVVIVWFVCMRLCMNFGISPFECMNVCICMYVLCIYVCAQSHQVDELEACQSQPETFGALKSAAGHRGE